MESLVEMQILSEHLYQHSMAHLRYRRPIADLTGFLLVGAPKRRVWRWSGSNFHPQGLPDIPLLGTNPLVHRLLENYPLSYPRPQGPFPVGYLCSQLSNLLPRLECNRDPSSCHKIPFMWNIADYPRWFSLSVSQTHRGGTASYKFNPSFQSSPDFSSWNWSCRNYYDETHNKVSGSIFRGSLRRELRQTGKIGHLMV